MVNLKNIERKGDHITCDVYIEDCTVPMHVDLNIATQKFAPFTYPEGYDQSVFHMIHAKRFLLDNADDLPQERLIMWY